MKTLIALIAALALSACGGGSAATPSGSTTTPTYRIGGTVTGLTGSVVLQDNHADKLTVATNGAFAFVTPIASGGAYSVSVLTQAAGQTCTVTNGSGTASSDVADIAVYCITQVAITTSGNRLLKDGVVWISHGVVLEAFSVTPAELNDPAIIASNAHYRNNVLPAYQHFSVAELDAIKAWGADTVRFNVSQAGLDPQNSLYSADFVSTVKTAVLAARATGLNVIVCLFGKQETPKVTLPSDVTIRAWNVLAPLLNGDGGILYEVFNEPEGPPTTENWATWANAYNPVIAAIRATGATNVVLADGLYAGLALNGVVPLTDPLNKLAYATHPWFASAGFQTQAAWDRDFGNLAATAPVIVTAWVSGNKSCDADTAAASLALLQYLQSKHIGLVGYGYDVIPHPNLNSIVSDYNGTPTTFSNGIQCGQPGFGAGAIIQDWFRTGTPPTQLK